MRELNNNEKKLMNKLLQKQFSGREIILEQLKNAIIIPFYEPSFISLKFIVKNQQKFPYKLRVPVEMVATHLYKAPIVIILHLNNGYIDELEIFNADSSLINIDIDYEEYKYEITINENLIII